MASVFPAKWPRASCPACGYSWKEGDLVGYNSDDLVVHERCLETPILDNYKGKKETVCGKCFLTTCDCE